MPPIFWMSSVASSRTTSTMSSTVTMPRMRPSASSTGTAIRLFSAITFATASWSRSSRTEITFDAHHVAHARVGLGGEELAERDDADEPLLGVEHVDVVDRLDALARGAPQVGDRLVDRHVGAQAHVARAHQAAGLVLGVGEQRRHLAAGRRVERGEQRLALLGLGRLHGVGGVVRRELPHPELALGGVQREHQRALLARLEAFEQALGLAGIEQAEALEALLGVERGPGVAQIFGEQSGPALRLSTRHDPSRAPGGS